jgi:predicted GNAT superfamily acetyltransferase
MRESIRISPLTTIEEYADCERLQQVIWESDPVEVVPGHLLITFQRHGGMVLGAFDTAGQMVGFSFGFLGHTSPDNPLTAGSAWQHCSHELGVVRAWRGQGVGYQLKLAQREWVMRQGLDLITWTYDPLETANASLNIGKLGAACRCYLRDLYGAIPDGLNAHLPSDRFEVAWRLASPRVARRVKDGWQSPSLAALTQGGAALVNPAQAKGDGRLVPAALRQVEAPRILIEVPANFQALKQQDLELAKAWRLHSREAFEMYFSLGYSVGDVLTAEVNSARRAYYLLEKTDTPA